jgi:ADP-heptose:LPS heptosyltransferase
VRVCGDIAAWVGALSGASAAIAVNTGPMHVASAIGIPVVLLEGSSRLPLWQPPCPPFSIVTHQAEIPCAPCHQVGDGRRCRFRCMAAITAKEVLRAYDDGGQPHRLCSDCDGSACILPDDV